MFRKKDRMTNERTIYQTRQNPIIGCKKFILGLVLLIILFSVASPIISFIGGMQTYLISYVNLTLTRYVAIALFVIILFIILYMIWNLLQWYFTVYTLTNYRVITQKGILRTKKTYMQYSNIQDVNTSQSLIEKLVNVGSISLYSAYDNNDVELKNISNPGDIEEMIFNEMKSGHYGNDEDYSYQSNHSSRHYNSYEDDYRNHQNYHNKKKHRKSNRRKKHRYPKDDYNNTNHRKYEYEKYPYNDDLEDNINHAMNDMGDNIKFEGFNPEYKKYNNDHNDYHDDVEVEPYYNDPDYESMEDYYNNNKQDFQFDQEEEENIDSDQRSPVERHFDKFKKQ